MNPSETVWVRHTWRLQSLSIGLKPPAGYNFRSALAAELDWLTQVVLSAYASDPVWKPLMTGIEKRMRERISTTLGTKNSDYIVAERDGRIVAVSGIAKSHWTDQNFLTGICVLPQHQRKGLGKYLLGLSLSRLRGMGLSNAQVYTEAGSLADRKIYSLFGSTRERGVEYPGLRPSPNETPNQS